MGFARGCTGFGLAEELLNPVGDEEGFVFAVGGLVITDQASALAISPKLLALTADVVGNDGAGGFENDLR